MTTVADNNNMRDWVANCDGEEWERAVRDSGDSWVVMMAVVAEDGCSRWQQWRRTTTAADNNGMWDWAADYEGEGQEQEARDGIDTEWQWRLRRWKMAVVDDSSGQWQWWMASTATADDNSGGWRRRQTMTARKIGQRTTRGKEGSGQQTTTTLDKRLISLPGRERERINKSSLCKKTFSAIRSVQLDVLLLPKQPMSPFRSISLM